MSILIKLCIQKKSKANLKAVRQLRGLEKLSLDEEFGLVCVSPKKNLYVVRTDSEVSEAEAKERQEQNSDILGFYGDVRIGLV
jgi:hypothetical protein